MSAPDMGDLLRQAQQMQEQLMAAQEAAAAEVVEGQAGGGMVRIKITGAMEITGVQIDPSVVDPADIDLLEDLVLAAIHDAMAKAGELSQQAMGGALGGLDLGGLLGGGALGQG